MMKSLSRGLSALKKCYSFLDCSLLSIWGMCVCMCVCVCVRKLLKMCSLVSVETCETRKLIRNKFYNHHCVHILNIIFQKFLESPSI